MHRPRHTTLAALLVLALALSRMLAHPMRSYAAVTIIYVDAGASGAGDGRSWTNAYPGLADAMAGTAFDTKIQVAAGTYDMPPELLQQVGVTLPGQREANATAADERPNHIQSKGVQRRDLHSLGWQRP